MELNQEKMNALLGLMQFVDQRLEDAQEEHFSQDSILEPDEIFELEAFFKVDELFFDGEFKKAAKKAFGPKEEPEFDWDSERKSRRDIEEGRG